MTIKKCGNLHLCAVLMRSNTTNAVGICCILITLVLLFIHYPRNSSEQISTLLHRVHALAGHTEPTSSPRPRHGAVVLDGGHRASIEPMALNHDEYWTIKPVIMPPDQGSLGHPDQAGMIEGINAVNGFRHPRDFECQMAFPAASGYKEEMRQYVGLCVHARTFAICRCARTCSLHSHRPTIV